MEQKRLKQIEPIQYFEATNEFYNGEYNGIKIIEFYRDEFGTNKMGFTEDFCKILEKDFKLKDLSGLFSMLNMEYLLGKVLIKADGRLDGDYLMILVETLCNLDELYSY